MEERRVRGNLITTSLVMLPVNSSSKDAMIEQLYTITRN